MRIALLLSFFLVSVADGTVEIAGARFGFGEGYKVGTWAPLVVTLQKGDTAALFSGELIVEVRSFASDMPLERYATPVQLVGTATQRKVFYVYCPENAAQLVIEVLPHTSSDSIDVNITTAGATHDMLLPTPVARKDYFVLGLTPSGDKLRKFIDKKYLAGVPDALVHVKHVPNLNALPYDWIGYSAVDVLVVREMHLTARRIRKAQQTAMLDWIQRGGTLIVSGGSNFNYLQGSFIEPFLPVQLEGVEKTGTLPTHLREQLGFQSSAPTENAVVFERIRFAPRSGCEVLIGTGTQIYVAKRTFGDGQILCLAFDYNAPPFSEQGVAETFWQTLLGQHGKSARHNMDRYALALQHEEETHKHFRSEMAIHVPLIKVLAIVLPVYLLSFGGFLLYFAKSRRKARVYWIGGCLFALLWVGAIASARKVLPSPLTADRLSVVSVYRERQRAHVLSYVSLRAAAPVETSVGFTEGTFVRHQEVEDGKGEIHGKIGVLVQGARVELRDMSVAPWHPTTFVVEQFLTLDTNSLPETLENTWRVAGKTMIYLGEVPLTDKSAVVADLASAAPRLQLTPKVPPDTGLVGPRRTFARILRRDYVFRYLAELNMPPYLIGWTSRAFSDMNVDGTIDMNDQNFVIFHPDAGRVSGKF